MRQLDPRRVVPDVECYMLDVGLDKKTHGDKASFATALSPPYSYSYSCFTKGEDSVLATSEGSVGFGRQHAHYLLKAVAVGIVESIEVIAVHVKDSNDIAFAVSDRDNNFGF